MSNITPSFSLFRVSMYEILGIEEPVTQQEVHAVPDDEIVTADLVEEQNTTDETSGSTDNDFDEIEVQKPTKPKKVQSTKVVLKLETYDELEKILSEKPWEITQYNLDKFSLQKRKVLALTALAAVAFLPKVKQSRYEIVKEKVQAILPQTDSPITDYTDVEVEDLATLNVVGYEQSSKICHAIQCLYKEKLDISFRQAQLHLNIMKDTESNLVQRLFALSAFIPVKLVCHKILDRTYDVEITKVLTKLCVAYHTSDVLILQKGIALNSRLLLLASKSVKLCDEFKPVWCKIAINLKSDHTFIFEDSRFPQKLKISILNDRQLIRDKVVTLPSLLLFAGDEIRNDEEFVKEAITSYCLHKQGIQQLGHAKHEKALFDLAKKVLSSFQEFCTAVHAFNDMGRVPNSNVFERFPDFLKLRSAVLWLAVNKGRLSPSEQTLSLIKEKYSNDSYVLGLLNEDLSKQLQNLKI